jgi:hypothetical protein
MFNGGDCALAFGISVIEAVIESVKNMAIVIAAILFLAISILIFLSYTFIFSVEKKQRSRLFSTRRLFVRFGINNLCKTFDE